MPDKIPTTPPIIAIDGPAAAGKSTLAKKLAAHFNFAHLDTGSLYRGLAHLVTQAGGDPSCVDDVLQAVGQFDPDKIDRAAIRTAEIGLAAAKLAVLPQARAQILTFQRDFAAQPPHGKKGAVLDGRDIGTVVCPQADAKIFIEANAQTRAHRRWLELKARTAAETPSQAQVLADIVARDKSDQTRKIAPLKAAEDALLLNTSNLSIEEAFKAALVLVVEKIPTLG